MLQEVSMAGKGDKPRPVSDRPRFESNWDRIFGKPKKSEPKDNKPK
jgi:hypothetical protein